MLESRWIIKYHAHAGILLGGRWNNMSIYLKYYTHHIREYIKKDNRIIDYYTKNFKGSIWYNLVFS